MGYGALWVMGTFVGHTAGGPRSQIRYQTCAAARKVMARRLNRMGLTDATWQQIPQGWALQVTLPADPAVARQIPHTLAQTGRFGVYPSTRQDQPPLLTASDIARWVFTLKEFGNPLVLAHMSQSAYQRLHDWQTKHPSDHIEIWLDKTLILSKPNTPPLSNEPIELRDSDSPLVESLRTTNAWYVILADGPLPCPARLTQFSTGDAD